MVQAKLCLGRRVSTFCLVLLLLFSLFLPVKWLQLLGRKRQDGVGALSVVPPLQRAQSVTLCHRARVQPHQAGTRALLTCLPPLALLDCATCCQDKATFIPRVNKPQRCSHASPRSWWDQRDTRGSSQGLPKYSAALRNILLPNLEREEDVPALWVTCPATAGKKSGGEPLLRTWSRGFSVSSFQEFKIVTYVSCCLANLDFHKSPVNYLLSRAKDFTTVPCPGPISHINL